MNTLLRRWELKLKALKRKRLEVNDFEIKNLLAAHEECIKDLKRLLF